MLRKKNLDLVDTPGSMALPGSPFYSSVRRDPNLPTDGPERYVCRVAVNNPVPNPVRILKYTDYRSIALECSLLHYKPYYAIHNDDSE